MQRFVSSRRPPSLRSVATAIALVSVVALVVLLRFPPAGSPGGEPGPGGPPPAAAGDPPSCPALAGAVERWHDDTGATPPSTGPSSGGDAELEEAVDAVVVAAEPTPADDAAVSAARAALDAAVAQRCLVPP
jgi:hypothetical protein